MSWIATPATAPGPSGPQMLGAMGVILRDPLRFLTRMRDTYGDVVQFPIPRPPTYFVASPEGIRQVLVADSRRYDKDTIQYRSLALVTGDGLLTARSSDWRQQRTVVQPAFHRTLLPVLTGIVEQETARTIEPWRRIGRPSVVDVEGAMMQLSLRIVGRALFGDDLRGEAAALADATVAALEVVIQRSRVPVAVPPGWPTPANRKLARSRAALDAAVARLVQQRRQTPRRVTSGPPMLLDLLLDDPGATPQRIRDQVVTFLVAGHETAASGLTWALWLLADDPQAQRRSSESGDYAKACADEALRLYPPAWVISRNAAAPTSVAGREIPAGALVIISPYVTQRDPRYWSDAGRFLPDRFGADLDTDVRRAYLPFGAGPRLCIGRDFALWEMTIVLREMCRRLHWNRYPGQPDPGVITGVTLRPAAGLRLEVQRPT